MATTTKRTKGSIEQLPSGALRISVYAGIDPVTGRRHYLKETVEPGPRAERDAEAVRTRLVSEVAERRSPRTAATVDQLLERREHGDGAELAGHVGRGRLPSRERCGYGRRGLGFAPPPRCRAALDRLAQVRG